MALYPVGVISREQLEGTVESAKAKLDPNEVRFVRYSIGIDSSGETTIFFRILLSDDASQEPHVRDFTVRVAEIIFNEIKPWENWGVLPEFTFRSESEQRQHYDVAWA